MSDTDPKKTPSQRRRDRERKRRREDILKTAEQLFITQGFEKTMMDQVAQEAGFSKATLYKYFETKEDLYLAVAAIGFQKFCQVIEDTLSKPEIKYELRSLAYPYLTFISEYTPYAQIIDDSLLRSTLAKIIKKEEQKQALTESEKEFRSHQQKSLELLTRVVAATMTNSDIQNSLSPLNVAIALSTIGTGIIKEFVLRAQLFKQSRKETKDQLQLIFDLIDTGLRHYRNNTEIDLGD